jgi:hypothetical protein
VDDTSADAGVATDLAAALILDSDWYGLLLDSNSGAEIAAAAAWALAHDKLAGFVSIDTENTTASTGIAYDLSQLSNHNAFVIASHDSLGQGEAGLMGRQFSRTPGSSSWVFKEIAGQIPDAWTPTEFSNLRSNGAILYVEEGVKRTYDGFACSGRFLDITRGLAWLKARVREACLAQLVTVEKVPYTLTGLALIEAAISGVLAQAEKNGLIASGWTATMPDLATISVANKAARLLPDVSFSAKLQGAINALDVDGTVVV